MQNHGLLKNGIRICTRVCYRCLAIHISCLRSNTLRRIDNEGILYNENLYLMHLHTNMLIIIMAINQCLLETRK